MMIVLFVSPRPTAQRSLIKKRTIAKVALAPVPQPSGLLLKKQTIAKVALAPVPQRSDLSSHSAAISPPTAQRSPVPQRSGLPSHSAAISPPSAPLKIHPQPQIHPPRSQKVRHRILGIRHCFNPGIRSHIGNLHQIIDLQTEPGLTGKTQWVVGFARSP